MVNEIIEYIKKVPRQNVKVIVTNHNVKVVYGYNDKTYDVMTLKEFKKEIGCG